MELLGCVMNDVPKSFSVNSRAEHPVAVVFYRSPWMLSALAVLKLYESGRCPCTTCREGLLRCYTEFTESVLAKNAYSFLLFTIQRGEFGRLVDHCRERFNFGEYSMLEFQTAEDFRKWFNSGDDRISIIKTVCIGNNSDLWSNGGKLISLLLSSDFDESGIRVQKQSFTEFAVEVSVLNGVDYMSYEEISECVSKVHTVMRNISFGTCEVFVYQMAIRMLCHQLEEEAL